MIILLSTDEGRKFVTDTENVHSLTDELLENTDSVRVEGHYPSVEVSDATDHPTGDGVT